MSSRPYRNRLAKKQCIHRRFFRPRLESLESRLLLTQFTVNSADDFGDADLSDDACADLSQACTLRAAIEQSNHKPDRDTIVFTAGLPTIFPLKALPSIDESVTIDGYTGGGSPNTNSSIKQGTNAQLTVEIDGSLSEAGAVGLKILASRVVITGLVINNFSDYGILIDGGEQNEIQGNFIGTDRSGTEAAAVRSGVAIINSNDNLIGGAAPADRNILSGNWGEGVIIAGSASENKVKGNYIGTDRTGTQRVSNFQGILFTSDSGGSSVYASNNLIGGTEPDAGNIISGNERDGIFVLRGDQNKVKGNFIGTDALGLNPLPNGRAGIRIVEGNNNIVGGTAPGAGNVVSGNDRSGIVIRVGDLFEDTPNPPLPNTSKDAIDNEIQGNLIGIDADGLKPLPNVDNGILLDSVPGSEVVLTGSKIGGPTFEQRNVISGNGEAGIAIHGANSSANRILGNFIGTDGSGSVTDPDGKSGTDDELGNGHDGILIVGGQENVIGGLDASEKNVISGNAGNGIRVQGKTAVKNEIVGNTIGAGQPAIARLPNQLNGILIHNAPETRIGSALSGGGNIILGNRLNGIQIQGPDATGTRIENNDIGLVFFPFGMLGNTQNGVIVADDAHDNTIGGSEPSSGNRIVANGFGGLGPGHGIVIKSGTGNRIQRNSIFNNNGLGIDLGEDGLTSNDDDDSDSGANRLQNFPTFTTSVDAGQTKLSGTLQSTPNSTFVVEFFSNVSGGPLDNHEGQTFLDNIGVFTDGSGKAEVSITFSGIEEHVTATVTDIDGNTSEFARSRLIHSVEFTQAIQVHQTLEDLQKDLAGDGTPPMPIVAGKPLALRVYLNQLSDPAHVEIEAVGPGHIETKKGLLYRECDVSNQRRKDTLAVGTCFSADFIFDPPPGMSTYTVTLKDNKGQVRESHELVVDARLTKSLVLKEVAVCDAAPFNANQCQPVGVLQSVVNGVDVDSRLREIMPTHQIDIQASWHVIRLNMIMTDLNQDGDDRDCFQFVGCERRKWMHKVTNEAEQLFTSGDELVSPVATVRYVAVTRNNLPGAAGVGKPLGATFQSSTSLFGTEAIDGVIAHEMGHSLGLSHTNVAPIISTTAPGCWNVAPNASSDWPYPNNQIQSGPVGSSVPEVGFNVSTGAALLPGSVFEMMSYCWPMWISPHNYLKLVNAFTLTSSAAKNGHDHHQGEFWLVSGEIGEQGTVLDPLYVLDTEASLHAGEGTHRIVIQDAEGETLRERFFTPTASEAVTLDGEESVGTPSFSELVRVMPDAARIVLIDPSDAELHRVTLTGAAPAVNVDFAPAGEPVQGVRVVRWSVEDADNESHAFRIEYSADGGGVWASLGTELTDGELNVNFDRLAGSDGQALLRVYASDGVNSSHAVSKPFSVSFKLPSASIQQPEPDAEFDLGQNIVMRAAGFDMDDGYLGDDSLRWNSNLDGHLGNGSFLLVDDLSEGIHQITLLATDDSGNDVSDQVTISVADRIHIVGQHPGFLRFDSASFDVNEDAGEATITVVRDEGTSGTISVDYATVAETAQEGSDYIAVNGTLTFEDGQETSEFTIPIIDNSLGDPSTKSVRLLLQNPSAATIIVAPKSAELLIHDDELANGTVLVVTNTNDNGAGSLRQAINDANARPRYRLY